MNILDIGSDFQESLLMFCFSPIIQQQLNKFQRTWNLRHCRQSSRAPAGKPDILLKFPHTVGFKSKGIPIKDTDIAIADAIFDNMHVPSAVKNTDHLI